MNEGHQFIEPPGWSPPKGYANGVLAAAGSRWLAIAGQVGWNAEAKLVSADFVPQMRQALENIRAVLQAAGGEPEDLLRLTFYVTDKEEYLAAASDVGQVYRDVLGRHFPACALVEVTALLEPGAKIEIEATAALPPWRFRNENPHVPQS